MRVLHIEHGIFRRLALGQIEIEIEMAVVFAKEKEKAHHVLAHLFDQFVERDVSGFAGGHLDLFGRPRERHKLIDNGANRRGVAAERLERRDHLLMLRDVIRAEHVDDLVKAMGMPGRIFFSPNCDNAFSLTFKTSFNSATASVPLSHKCACGCKPPAARASRSLINCIPFFVASVKIEFNAAVSSTPCSRISAAESWRTSPA